VRTVRAAPASALATCQGLDGASGCVAAATVDRQLGRGVAALASQLS
jgi:hypothetical protein